MQDQHCFGYVYRLLHNNEDLFGRVPVVLGGDFARADLGLKACLRCIYR